MTPYAQDLVTKIKKGIGTLESKPLNGWKIIVDAGNGAGGFFAEKVLNSLGADSTGSQFWNQMADFLIISQILIIKKRWKVSSRLF